MKKIIVTLSASYFLFSSSAFAQAVYSPLTWGINKTTNPSDVAANVNGLFKSLGTLNTSTGTWEIPGTNLTFNPGVSGSVTRTINAKLSETLSVKDFGAVGDGLTDDGPAFRSAISYCESNPTFKSIYIPTTNAGYLINSIDSSGLGALVFGKNGTGSGCSIIGQAENTVGSFTNAGGASIHLGGMKIYNSTYSISATSTNLTSTTSVFTPSMVGSYINIPGAGAAGGILRTTVSAYNSATSINVALAASTTVSSVSTYVAIGTPLNVPLVYVKSLAGSPTFSNISLYGNREGQTGSSGLFTVYIENGSPSPESAIHISNSYILGGFNGNILLGSGRGTLFLDNVWSQYSGQSLTDASIYLNGYDSTFNNVQVGPNEGIGIRFGFGSQYIMSNSAIFMNKGDGIYIEGKKVTYMLVSNTNIQKNGCNGINDANIAASPTLQPSGHIFTNVTFEGNSDTSAGVCSDVKSDTNSLLSLVNPSFVGSGVVGAFKLPKYNIELLSGSSINVVAPTFGTTPYTTAWANYPQSVNCASCNIENTWTPILRGSIDAGTPTYLYQYGYYTKNNNEITAHFWVQVSDLGAPSGDMQIAGLPLNNSGTSGNIGVCYISSVSGWTAAAGYTTLTGEVDVSSPYILLAEIGSGKTFKAADASEFSNTTTLVGVCSYQDIPNSP